MPMRHSQKGNALWFILVGIVLLAALTMLLTRSGDTVSQSADAERLRIGASQLMRYAKGIENAVDQMKLRGISEGQISFQNTITTANYTNAACTTPDCKIFDPAGGGQEYRDPPGGVNDGSEWIFTGANNIGTTANPIGTTAIRTGNDLIALLPNVDQDLCVQINRELDVGTAGTLPQDGTAIATTAFTGSYANSLTIIDGASQELDGKAAGCFTATNPNPDVIYFYYVLMAR